MNINEVKISKPGLVFTKYKPVVGRAKVKTELFDENQLLNLIDLGTYYSFLPYGDQQFVILIPRTYIEKTNEIGYAVDIVKDAMDNIKNLIDQDKTILLDKNKSIENINEVKISVPNKLIPGKKYWVHNIGTWEYLEFEKEFGNKDNTRLLFKTDNGNMHVGKRSALNNKEISFSKEKPNYEPIDENLFSKEWWKSSLQLDEVKIQPPSNYLKVFKNPSGVYYAVFNEIDPKVNRNSTLKNYFMKILHTSVGNSIYYYEGDENSKPLFRDILKKLNIKHEINDESNEIVISTDNIKVKDIDKWSLYDEDINGWYNKIPIIDQTNENLNESPPNNFEEDDNNIYIQDNLDLLNKAALEFNYPIGDLEYAFNTGQETILNDDIWSNMKNTNSYNIQSIGQVLLYAKQHKIDILPYIKAIKNLNELPLPLVLRYGADDYYLVGGELVLSLYKALGVNPTVLIGTISSKIDEVKIIKPIPNNIKRLEQIKSQIEIVNNKATKSHFNLKEQQEPTPDLTENFIQYCLEYLKLSKRPEIEISDDLEHVKEIRSFGYFNPNDMKIWVFAGDRIMADVFRTLAHELVHRKQDEDGKINYESGETGSDIENEANSIAGVILRDFGKQNEEIYINSIQKKIDEVKIQLTDIKFTFPFWITKQNKSKVPFIVDQLNKQGYTLKGKKFTEEDITFNIPTVLDYDSNYREFIKRKILNTYSPSNEVKIANPNQFRKIPFEIFKQMLIEDMKETAYHLEFENPEEFISEFSDKLNEINNGDSSFENITRIYEEMGWGSNEFLYILNRILIK